MEQDLIVCIPGPWANRSAFIEALITNTGGEYMFAGGVLAHHAAKDYITAEFEGRYANMAEAFRIAGQGRVAAYTLKEIDRHQGVAYLHFPLDIVGQAPRLAKFTDAVSRGGGFAVKLETSGVAHEWVEWFSLIGSDDLFDLYQACVTLVADERHYYSCGMHHFSLPEVQVSRKIEVGTATELMNQFNFWQIAEKPNLEPGHTFSLSAEGDRYRVDPVEDKRHAPDDLFHNRNGLWDLARV